MSEVRGLVEYPVTDQTTQLFPGLSNGMTLYVTGGSSRIWVGTTGAVRKGIGLPMNPLASISWDRDKPMYACTEGPGLTATIIGLDLQASVNDPTLLASLISGGTVDATAIANAIAASGLTSAGIAGAINAGGFNAVNIANAILAILNPIAIGDEVGLSVPTAGQIGAAVGAAVPSAASIGAAVPSAADIGAAVPSAAAIAGAIRTGVTPVVLQVLDVVSAVAPASAPFTVWVGAAAQAAGWTVPAGKTLVVRHVGVQALNTGVVALMGRFRLVEGGGGGQNKVHHAMSLRLAANGTGNLSQSVEGSTIQYGAGVEPQVRDVTGVVGVTFDMNLVGVLF